MSQVSAWSLKTWLTCASAPSYHAACLPCGKGQSQRGSNRPHRCRCAHRSPANPNERSRRRRSSKCRHSSGLRSLLLALVGVLGEVGALGDSNRGGLLCPRCARRRHSCLGRCGRVAGCHHSRLCACGRFLLPTTGADIVLMMQRVAHYHPEPPIHRVVTADVAIRHGARLCSRSCCILLAIFCSM